MPCRVLLLLTGRALFFIPGGVIINGKTSIPYASGYGDAGASLVKKALRAFMAVSASPQEDIDDHNYTLRQRGRMLYMAAPVATSAIRTMRTNVVGVGLTMRSRIKREILGMTAEAAAEWQKRTESEWAIWSEKKQNCDAIGVSNFNGLQSLALTSALMSGDCFALLQRVKPSQMSPYGLRIRLVEADLVSTPDRIGVLPGISTESKLENGNTVFDGVEIDSKTNAIIAYHISNRYPSAARFSGEEMKWQRVEAYGRRTGLPNVLHIMEPERAGQYRGVTFLAPVIEQLLQIRRYTEAELMAAIIQSFFTAWITTESDPAGFPTNEVIGEDEQISEDPNEYEMGAGQVIHLKPGEQVHFGNPNIPTNGFDAFVKSIATQIGASLEIPRDVLLKEFNASYSASRAALLEAFRAFKHKRQWLVDDFCQPTYEVWLAEAIARGRIEAPGFFADPLIRAAYCGAQWIGPAQSQIDPLKEVKADIMAVDAGFKSYEQAVIEREGGDLMENIEQLITVKEKLSEMVNSSNTDVQEEEGEET